MPRCVATLCSARSMRILTAAAAASASSPAYPAPTLGAERLRRDGMPGTSAAAAAAADRSNRLTSSAVPSPEASPGDTMLPPWRALLGLVLLQRCLLLLLSLLAVAPAGSGWVSEGSSLGQGELQGFQRGGLVLGARAGDLGPG